MRWSSQKRWSCENDVRFGWKADTQKFTVAPAKK